LGIVSNSSRAFPTVLSLVAPSGFKIQISGHLIGNNSIALRPSIPSSPCPFGASTTGGPQRTPAWLPPRPTPRSMPWQRYAKVARLRLGGRWKSRVGCYTSGVGGQTRLHGHSVGTSTSQEEDSYMCSSSIQGSVRLV